MSQNMQPRPLSSLQARFIKSGFEDFSDQEIIELFLSFSLNPCECGEMAKRCLEAFGSAGQFLMASPRELGRGGLSSFSIFTITLLHELPAKILKEKIIQQPIYNSSKEIFDYLFYSMRDLDNEVFKTIFLNNRNQIIDVETLCEGTQDSVPVHPREIIENCIRHGSAAVVFTHNHPSGDPAPSQSDKKLTRDMVLCGDILQLRVLDHIIIGNNDYYSFADNGLIEKYKLDFLNLKLRKLSDSWGGGGRWGYSGRFVT